MRVGNFERTITDYRVGRHAFTLVEMAITVAIFSMVIAGLVYSHMFGLRLNQLVQSKCGASASSRIGFDKLERDIRSCKMYDIGAVSGSGASISFTAIADTFQQRGRALKLNLTTDTNQWIIYYFDTSVANNGKLIRYRKGDTSSSVIASKLYSSSYFPSNSMFFAAEDYKGDQRYDRAHKNVIHTVLEFLQFQYPLTQVGTNYLYDYYKMEFRLTPHAPD